mmetsp:Transcript_25496/g.58818  ORF Transcript_25496/g.58818 Transcript_25496/m.58818 type:complete len:329 (+) Transcript_25496:1879-2865(+)
MLRRACPGSRGPGDRAAPGVRLGVVGHDLANFGALRRLPERCSGWNCVGLGCPRPAPAQRLKAGACSGITSWTSFLPEPTGLDLNPVASSGELGTTAGLALSSLVQAGGTAAGALSRGSALRSFQRGGGCFLGVWPQEGRSSSRLKQGLDLVGEAALLWSPGSLALPLTLPLALPWTPAWTLAWTGVLTGVLTGALAGVLAWARPFATPLTSPLAWARTEAPVTGAPLARLLAPTCVGLLNASRGVSVNDSRGEVLVEEWRVRRWFIEVERPKSQRRRCPSRPIIRLSGLMSRWTMCRLCRYSSADTMSQAYCRIQCSGTEPNECSSE